MKKSLLAILFLTFAFVAGDAEAVYISLPTNNQTAQSVFEFGTTPTNFIIDIPSAGAAARVQLPANVVTSCTLQAASANTGKVFVGGATVTNAAGTNEGISFSANDTYGPISVINSNLIYLATETAGNDVKVFCN